jgi:adenylate kinase
MRAQPNIVLTGTPGTGKSTHADALAAALPALRALDVGAYARSKALTKAYDEAWASWELDEEALLDALEEEVRPGGVVLDWHCSEIYPERWVDLVVVLTCDHELLWTRLEKR